MKLRRENAILREEREILKSGGVLRARCPVVRYKFIVVERDYHAVRTLSLFWIWTRRERSDSELAVHIKGIHRESRGT